MYLINSTSRWLKLMRFSCHLLYYFRGNINETVKSSYRSWLCMCDRSVVVAGFFFFFQIIVCIYLQFFSFFLLFQAGSQAIYISLRPAFFAELEIESS